MEQAELGVRSLRLEAPKEAYIRSAHSVDSADVIEVFNNLPRFFHNATGKGAPGVMLGPTRAGRFLLVAIAPTDEEGEWRVITAYWLNEGRGRRLCEGRR